MIVRKLTVGLAALLLLGACSSSTPSAAPTTPTTTSPQPTTTEPTATTAKAQPPTTQAPRVVAGSITVPNMVGEDLQLAQDTMQAAGLYSLRSHDATGQARTQVLDRAWKVCDQAPQGGTKVASDQLIDFGAVRDEERCP